jgi:hypothetical protein
MALKDWFYNTFGSRRGPKVDEIMALTKQFHVTLQAYITKIEDTFADSPPNALKRIREITGTDFGTLSWHDAYHIEQQLVHLYDEETIKVELPRRLLEADASLHPSVSQWYRESAAKVTELDGKRALLSRLINDLQWRYTRNEARRGYKKEITARTELIFMVAVGLFLVCVFVLLGQITNEQGLGGNHWGLIPFVGTAGAFGASFSMMISLRQRLADSSFDDLKLNRSLLMVLARVLIGTGAGFLLFFFVKSGLLGGDAFPVLGEEVGHKALESLSAMDFAKLFIWSFIAGFSEKLIPNLLSKTEGQNIESTPPPVMPGATASPGGPLDKPTRTISPAPGETADTTKDMDGSDMEPSGADTSEKK